MKRRSILAGLMMVLACGTNAWSTVGTITFDSPPDTVTPPTVNTFVSTEYGTATGVNFLFRTDFTNKPYYPLLNFTAGTLVGGTLGTPTGWTNEAGAATTYSGLSTPTTNFLGFNKSPVAGDGSLPGTAIQFDSILNSLSLKLDRPGSNGGTTTVVTDLYNTVTGALVATNTTIVTAGSGFATVSFTQPTTKVFNLAVLHATNANRFMLDDLTFNTVQRNRIDVDGDGKTDLAVFRPSEGNWYGLQSSTGTSGSLSFGTTGDIPVASDYDGDGMTDAAVFRPSEGNWFIEHSSDGSQRVVNFGINTDTPVTGDFDGDGKTDVAVFRPSDGNWYILNSSNSISTVVPYGTSGDITVPGDYDGDGKTDVAVFRPSGGNWYILQSSGTQVVEAYGTSGDIPVPGDYDGDGKTDVAVFRPSGGNWYVKNSSNGSQNVVSYGLGTDIPVPGDYDGDAKTDVAVFRPSDGNWYIKLSTGSESVVQFGTNGDIPISVK